VRTARDSTPVILVVKTSLTCSLHARSTLSSWLSLVNSRIDDVDTQGLTTATDDDDDDTAAVRCNGDRSVMSAATVSASVLAILTLTHRHTQTDTHRQTHRHIHTDKQTYRPVADPAVDIHTDKQTYRPVADPAVVCWVWMNPRDKEIL